MKPKHHLSFKLKMKGKVVMDFGRLYWPWPIQEVRDNGYVVEIVDARSVSTINLEDITLEDLYKAT